MTITFDLKESEVEPKGDRPMRLVHAVADALHDLTGYLHISFLPIEELEHRVAPDSTAAVLDGPHV